MEFTRFNEQGSALMVDVGEKADTKREVVAKGSVFMSSECPKKVAEGTMVRGDVLGVARVAGIMGAKRTSDLIPLCHTLNLTKLPIDFTIVEESCEIQALCITGITGKIGAEMETLTGVTVALLTVHDMCKAVDKTMELGTIYLDRKSGGKGGDFHNPRTEMQEWEGFSMEDSFGRSIDYMRTFITDRCNLRCRHCMPDGVECLAHREILTLEEIEAVVIYVAGLGISRIKVTGGESLVRRDCCQLVKVLKSILEIEKVTITTNGVLLDRCLVPLLEARIDGINISLDVLDSFLCRKITGLDRLGRVMETMELAAGQPAPVKINAISIDFSPTDESGEPAAVSGSTGWKQMVDLTERYPINVRFIRMMPIGYGKQFKTINHKDLLEETHGEYPGLEEDRRQHGYGPAVYYRIPGILGSVGLISTIHGKSCNDYNRTCLTSQGYLKIYLCYEDGTDSRTILREGTDMSEGEGHYRWPLKDCPDDEMPQKCLPYAMRQAIEHKSAARCFERPGQITESHSMIFTGG